MKINLRLIANTESNFFVFHNNEVHLSSAGLRKFTLYSATANSAK